MLLVIIGVYHVSIVNQILGADDGALGNLNSAFGNDTEDDISNAIETQVVNPPAPHDNVIVVESVFPHVLVKQLVEHFAQFPPDVRAPVKTVEDVVCELDVGHLYLGSA